VPSSAVTATVISVHFDPVQVLPPTDPLTTPLLPLMLATDDVRFSRLLFIETSERLRAAAPNSRQQQLLAGEQWYGMRMLCSHLHEGIDAVRTLRGTVGPATIRRILQDQDEALEAFARVWEVAEADNATRQQIFVYKARNWVGAHYQNEDVGRVYSAHTGVPAYIQGLQMASDVGGLVRFVLTDTLTTSLLLDAAGADLPATVETEADAAKVRAAVVKAWEASADEVLPLSQALTTFVDSLTHTLVLQRGYTGTARASIEIPPLLRAARETEAARREGEPHERRGHGDVLANPGGAHGASELPRGSPSSGKPGPDSLGPLDRGRGRGTDCVPGDEAQSGRLQGQGRLRRARRTGRDLPNQGTHGRGPQGPHIVRL
jgi:hypothetical protein